jgi:prepilin-type N-terminal cleavage/methylation domain-containing protein/prepilin-type processing-associated H-X9-DG protein
MSHSRNPRSSPGFTLVEVLVVLAVIALLAGLLLPALGRARQLATATACRSNLRQQALAWELYLGEHADRFPDRRDLKTALPGGYRPWTSWPPSDPRAGWVAVVLSNELAAAETWRCPAARGAAWAEVPQIWQTVSTTSNAPRVGYWMWRFDRPDEPVPADNFWGKTRGRAVSDLAAAGNPQVGVVTGPAEVEFVTDVYFPATAPTVEEERRGRAPHPRGRNRLYLDGHAAWWRDARLR